MTALFDETGVLQPHRTAAEMAAKKLRESIAGNINHRESRELEALQGIGFALLAIAEHLAGPAQRPQTSRPRRFRLRRAAVPEPEASL